MTVKDLKGMLAAYPEEMVVTQMCVVVKTDGGDMTMIYPSSPPAMPMAAMPSSTGTATIKPTDSLFNG